LFNERYGYLKRTIRETFPRSIKERGGLSPEFTKALREERMRLINGGVCPKKVNKLIFKAAKWLKG